MFQLLGDKEALDSLRAKRPDQYHCPWLRRDPNACNALPDGVDGIEPGSVCPHNVYVNQSSVFANREGVSDTLERLFRLVNASEAGILSESDLDPLSTTELLTAKNELSRQQSERTKREYEKAKLEAHSNQGNGIDFDAKDRAKLNGES